MIILGSGCSRGEKAPEVAWARIYDGGNSDAARGVAVDSSGNVYVTGRSFGAETNDYLTIKYDHGGNVLWTMSYDGGGRDDAEDIALGSSGNVYVTGSSRTGKKSGWATIKYDSDGNEIWTRSPDCGGGSIAVDSSGNFYVTCNRRVIKYDREGGQVWAKSFDAAPRSYAVDVAVDSSGNVYVAVALNNGLDFDYLTLKYDANGNIAWRKPFNTASGGPAAGTDDSKRDFTTEGNDFARGIAVDSSGNVYVTGKTITNDSGTDCLTIKYDPDGNVVWAKTYNRMIAPGPSGGDDSVPDLYSGVGATDFARDIAVDSSGNVYVTGGSKAEAAKMKFLTIKYDSSGNVVWDVLHDAGKQGYANSIAVGSSGNILVTGFSVKGSSWNFLTVKYE